MSAPAPKRSRKSSGGSKRKASAADGDGPQQPRDVDALACFKCDDPPPTLDMSSGLAMKLNAEKAEHWASANGGKEAARRQPEWVLNAVRHVGSVELHLSAARGERRCAGVA